MEDISQKKEEQHFSVLRGEGSYFRKIISRDPSVGSTSSNGFLYFSPGNVPFNWEMQPGMSKTPPKNAESVPSIDPPPFLSNMELLPGPKIPEASKGSGPLGWSRVKFWVKIKKQRNLRKVEGRRSVDGLECADIRSRAGYRENMLRESGAEFVTASSNSSSSSSGSSSSSTSSRDSHLHPSSASKFHILAKELVKWRF
ncbi:hypothetical protein CDL15_Pgr027108 [Punica granatum]|uniref:Uncharacterized protein n=1 Tax=Punica granatum TaxID=22663 RepID=A0A218XI30_PUNGR|nr:hypothetical protein CDL15_Pgr027108 [Punica granatum]